MERCVRRYLGARPDQDPTTIRAAANLGTSLGSHLRKMRLRWCGHVLQMGEERVTREVLMFEKAHSWKRPRELLMFEKAQPWKSPPGGFITTRRKTRF